MAEHPVEVTVGEPCEHGSFSVRVSRGGVWHLPGAGRIETEAEDFFVFHQETELCECWEYDDDDG